MKTETTAQTLVEELIRVLGDLPNVVVGPYRLEPSGQGSDRADASFELSIAGKTYDVAIEFRKAVYPRDVREIAWKMRQQDRARRGMHLLLADVISPGAKREMRELGVGYYDAGGSLFMASRDIYFYIDHPPKKAQRSPVRSLFTGRRADVMHLLLMRTADWFGVNDIAQAASVSPATASAVMLELDRLEWVVSRGAGPSKVRQIQDPGRVLDEWAQQARNQLHLKRFYIPNITTDAMLTRLDHHFTSRGVHYAITGEVAANHYAPFLTNVSTVTCRVVPGHGLDFALIDLGARVVDEGANLILIESRSSTTHLSPLRLHNSWLASPVQVYLDLLDAPGRAKDMAVHLRRETLGF